MGSHPPSGFSTLCGRRRRTIRPRCGEHGLPRGRPAPGIRDGGRGAASLGRDFRRSARATFAAAQAEPVDLGGRAGGLRAGRAPLWRRDAARIGAWCTSGMSIAARKLLTCQGHRLPVFCLCFSRGRSLPGHLCLRREARRQAFRDQGLERRHRRTARRDERSRPGV